ncbi:hypothetical protein Vadar_020459 [Vaccinium darrowii]|uniref:Uncharacterized protein n=1 Tax=Vaccinium darrowii TaxID=229202 RepID=A0ACB7Y9J2_9ERIC|nr:hypothetical protein Vadar_020459 [Vaccinium darrowii]
MDRKSHQWCRHSISQVCGSYNTYMHKLVDLDTMRRSFGKSSQRRPPPAAPPAAVSTSGDEHTITENAASQTSTRANQDQHACTTCIGNSGDLDESVASAITENDLVAAAVLSGNRNFEGRVHPLTRATYLASPPLVVVYALAGMVEQSNVLPDMFKSTYEAIAMGNSTWNRISVPYSTLYEWDQRSTYIKEPPFFQNMSMFPPGPHGVKDAYCLLFFGDSLPIDHVSPAGSIHKDSPAAKYLMEHGVDRKDFNSYGSR